jgi:DNA-binding MarR family transcriptional regulator
MCYYTYKRTMLDVDGPDSCYSLASKRGARYLARLYDRCFVPVNITSSQFSILSLIGHEPGITVVKLANLMVMERTSLVRALAPLEKAGFVTKSLPKSGRALEFSLTKAGSKKVSDAIPFWTAAQQEFEKEFGKEKAASLREILLSVA